MMNAKDEEISSGFYPNHRLNDGIQLGKHRAEDSQENSQQDSFTGFLKSFPNREQNAQQEYLQHSQQDFR